MMAATFLPYMLPNLKIVFNFLKNIMYNKQITKRKVTGNFDRVLENLRQIINIIVTALKALRQIT